MGTRSVIAIPLDNGFKGRYCHWDGYPSHMAVALHEIVSRDGVETALRVLTREHHSWSSIAPDRSPEELQEYSMGADVVPGYGCATPIDNSEADWWVENRGGDSGTEWAYILNERALSIFQRMHADETPAVGAFGFNDDNGFWLHAGDLAYDEPIDEEQLRIIECGENYERCGHIVGAHLEDAPEDVRGKGMRAYMGHEPLGWYEVVEVEVNGYWRRLAGSGGTGLARSDDWRATSNASPNQPRYWWAGVEGRPTSVRVARLVKGGYKLEVRARFMPTHDDPEQHVVAAGTVLTR